MKKTNYIIALILLLSTNMLLAQKFAVDTNKSSIEWIGKKIGGQHNGNIQLKSGNFEFKSDKLVSGTFVVDMNSITVTDIKDEGTNKKLVGHLISDDFFGVVKHPTASFSLTNVTKLSNGNTKITGNMTIKNKTEPITFEAENKAKIYTASIDIDRSKFDVRYGSNSFFDNLGNKAIDNIFVLNIKIVLKNN